MRIASLLNLALGLGLILLAAGCRSVKIQTGPPTDAEATQQSSDRGRQIRSDWANRLQGLEPVPQAALMRTFIDSTTANYIRYGYRVADRWRDEEDRRGSAVPVDEIRRMVENSNRTEMPVIEAHEDVLEYGIGEILNARFFEPATEELLTRYRDHYLDVYSVVFLPNGTRDDYEARLQKIQVQTETLSRELEEELRRYR